VEVTEEGRNSLVMQNLIDIPDVKINDIVLKIVRALAGMLEDIRTALDTADKAILNDIIERDNEVDKFYWLLNRLLKRMVVSKHSMSLSGLKDPRNLLEYATINKSLERAADHVVEISYELLNMGSSYLIGIPKDLRNKLGDMTSLDNKLLNSISKAFSESITLEEINRIIDLAKSESKSSIPNIMSEISKIEIDPALSASIRTIINSLSRIGEYISDIGEAIISLIIEQSM
jgi:Na+/phosphate symporter